MIHATPTKRGVGVTIYGDFLDFESLHRTIHAIIDAAPLDERYKEDRLLFLAYEVRHAYSGHREKITVDSETENTYFGTRLTWPEILFEVAILRRCAAFCENTKEHLSNLHRIEYCLEQALLGYDQKAGSEAVSAFRNIPLFTENFSLEFVSVRTYDYIFNCGAGKMRFRRLPAILTSLHDLSPEYKKFHVVVNKQAKRLGVHINELEDTRDWGEFEW